MCLGENTLMISTDCGLGGRVHPQIAWPKLRALRDGAREQKLWRFSRDEDNFRGT